MPEVELEEILQQVAGEGHSPMEVMVSAINLPVDEERCFKAAGILDANDPPKLKSVALSDLENLVSRWASKYAPDNNNVGLTRLLQQYKAVLSRKPVFARWWIAGVVVAIFSGYLVVAAATQVWWLEPRFIDTLGVALTVTAVLVMVVSVGVFGTISLWSGWKIKKDGAKLWASIRDALKGILNRELKGPHVFEDPFNTGIFNKDWCVCVPFQYAYPGDPTQRDGERLFRKYLDLRRQAEKDHAGSDAYSLPSLIASQYGQGEVSNAGRELDKSVGARITQNDWHKEPPAPLKLRIIPVGSDASKQMFQQSLGFLTQFKITPIEVATTGSVEWHLSHLVVIIRTPVKWNDVAHCDKYQDQITPSVNTPEATKERDPAPEYEKKQRLYSTEPVPTGPVPGPAGARSGPAPASLLGARGAVDQ